MAAQRILFITSNRLGDAVLSTGVLAHLIDAYPNAQFTVVCGPLASPLFRAIPHLQHLIVAQKRPLALHWAGVFALTVATRWSLIVDLRNVALLHLLRAQKAIRYRRAPYAMHKVEENARLLGIAPRSPMVWLDSEAQDTADEVGATGAVLALGPTAANPHKMWPQERYAELALRLTAPEGPLPGAQIAVMAASHERTLVQDLLATLPPERTLDLVGRLDVAAGAAFLARTALFVGNDSGLMHLAAAAGAPTLGLFGSGAPTQYRPWGPQSDFVEHRLPDAERLQWEVAPPEDHQMIMSAITVDEVEIAARRLLERTPR